MQNHIIPIDLKRSLTLNVSSQIKRFLQQNIEKIMHQYEEDNVFARIIRSELDCTKIYEDEHILCFEDNSKSAKIHWLFIPKAHHICYNDFISNSSPEVISHFFKTIQKVAEENNLDKEGYKLVTNNGKKAGQSVMHFHIHLLSGGDLSHL